MPNHPGVRHVDMHQVRQHPHAARDHLLVKPLAAHPLHALRILFAAPDVDLEREVHRDAQQRRYLLDGVKSLVGQRGGDALAVVVAHHHIAARQLVPLVTRVFVAPDCPLSLNHRAVVRCQRPEPLDIRADRNVDIRAARLHHRRGARHVAPHDLGRLPRQRALRQDRVEEHHLVRLRAVGDQRGERHRTGKVPGPDHGVLHLRRALRLHSAAGQHRRCDQCDQQRPQPHHASSSAPIRVCSQARSSGSISPSSTLSVSDVS